MARAAGSRVFPARFLLVAAMNPCPCGFRGDPRHACRCSRTGRRPVPPEDLGSPPRPDRPARRGPRAPGVRLRRGGGRRAVGGGPGPRRRGARPPDREDRRCAADERDAFRPGAEAGRQARAGGPGAPRTGGRPARTVRPRLPPGAQGRADDRRPGRVSGSGSHARRRGAAVPSGSGQHAFLRRRIFGGNRLYMLQLMRGAFSLTPRSPKLNFSPLARESVQEYWWNSAY